MRAAVCGGLVRRLPAHAQGRPISDFPRPMEASLPHSRERVRAVFTRASPSLVPAQIRESPGLAAGTCRRDSGLQRQGGSCGSDGLDAVGAEAGPVVLAGHDDGGLLVAEALNEGRTLASCVVFLAARSPRTGQHYTSWPPTQATPRCCVHRPDCGRGRRALWMERAVRISERPLRLVAPSARVREDARKHWGLQLTHGHI